MSFRTVAFIVGFILFIMGSLGIILSLVSVSLRVLYPIDQLGFFWAFIIKGLMIITGIITVYMAYQEKHINKNQNIN